MIKHLLGLCTLAASATTVFAQSSVTLYGVAEAGLLYSNNSGGASLAMLNSGSIQGSRWGLRGAEDLIVVGAAEMYEARCRRCFEPGIPKQSEMDFVKARKGES